MVECDTFMFIGSYTQKMGHTSGQGKGISIFKFNTTTAKTQFITTIPTSKCGESPAAFHIDNETHTIYICNESAATMTQVTFDPNNGTFGDESVWMQNCHGFVLEFTTSLTVIQYHYIILF